MSTTAKRHTDFRSKSRVGHRGARAHKARRGVSLVEVLIVVAIIGLGVIGAARVLQGATDTSAGVLGAAISALTPTDWQLGSFDDRPTGSGQNDGTARPTPSPSPGPAPTPPSDAEQGDDGNWFADRWNDLFGNGLWDEEKCRDFWSSDCLKEYAQKGALSQAWNSVKAAWDTGAEIVTGVWDIGKRWVEQPSSIWKDPYNNAKDCIADPGACALAAGKGLLETVWDDTSMQLWRDRDYSGVIGRTGVKVGLLAVGAGEVKLAVRALRGIFKPNPRSDGDSDEPAAADGGEQAPDPSRSDPPRQDCGADGVCPCFVAGTLVHAERGLVPIEEIELGEWIWSRDDLYGVTALRPVSRRFVTPNRPVLQLEFANGTTIRATSEHPFYTADGWKAAKHLQQGDQVMLLSNEWSEVKSGTSLNERTTVYNFEVDDYHTYFVGPEGLWVHNVYPDDSNPDSSEQAPARRGRETYNGGRFYNRQFTRAYDDIMAGGGQPRLDNSGNHVRYNGRENRQWEGAYEYEVPDPSGRLHHDSRILVIREGGRPDGRILKMGWVNPAEADSKGSGNKYKHIHELPENF